MNLHLTITLVFFLFLGCKNNSGTTLNNTEPSKILDVFEDDFTGEYSLLENGINEIKITKVNGIYYSEFWRDKNWNDKLALKDMTDKEKKELVGKDWSNFVESGLYSEMGFAIMKVKKGYKTKTHTFKTGYFAFLMMLPGDVYKK